MTKPIGSSIAEHTVELTEPVRQPGSQLSSTGTDTHIKTLLDAMEVRILAEVDSRLQQVESRLLERFGVPMDKSEHQDQRLDTKLEPGAGASSTSAPQETLGLQTSSFQQVEALEAWLTCLSESLHKQTGPRHLVETSADSGEETGAKPGVVPDTTAAREHPSADPSPLHLRSPPVVPALSTERGPGNVLTESANDKSQLVPDQSSTEPRAGNASTESAQVKSQSVSGQSSMEPGAAKASTESAQAETQLVFGQSCDSAT